MFMAKDKLRNKSPRYDTYVLIMLTAIELLMSFTFFGYIHIEPISITFAFIPVLMAAYLLGVKQSAFLGLVFGLASMYKATTYYIQPFDRMFSPFLSGYPLGSTVISVVSRTLFGFVIGLMCEGAKRSRHMRIWLGIVSVLTPHIHSLIVYAALEIFFPQMGYSIKNTLSLRLSDVLSSAVCFVIIMLLIGFNRIKKKQSFTSYIEKSYTKMERKTAIYNILFWTAVLIASVASAFYFSERITYMLSVHGIQLGAYERHDIVHLQIQFLIAIIAIDAIMAIVFIISYKLMKYREYMGKLDSLTGVMGRKMFVDVCENLKHENIEEKCFMFMDVDYFKHINDTYGHPAGDKVLIETAAKLKKFFGDFGEIGRMGGDEFAVISEKNLPVEMLKARLDGFMLEVSKILPEPERVTCSIGVCYFEHSYDITHIYAETDKLLYEAKKRGRNCYVIGRYNGKETYVINQ